MPVSLIIPALNEAESLGVLLAEIPTRLVDQVIVVDNGSTDQTAQVAGKAGALVIIEPRRGYGFACAAGAANATGELLVFMDGDGSFVPGELPKLLTPFQTGQTGLVLGSRALNDVKHNDMPAQQRFGNHLFTWLLRQRYGVMLTDLGPFRAIRRDLLKSLDMREFSYGWPLEMIIKTIRTKTLIIEVPITYRPRFAGQSKVSGTLRGTILTAYRYSRVMLRYST